MLIPTDTIKYENGVLLQYWCNPTNPSIGEYRIVEHSVASDSSFDIDSEFDNVDISEILTMGN